MKASELRIGNLILINEKVYRCVSGTIQEIAYEELSPKKVNKWEPIILNDNWLNKFGFEFKPIYLTKYTPCGKAIVFKDGYVIFTGVTIETPILYVHQLQNLYFALTEKELTI